MPALSFSPPARQGPGPERRAAGFSRLAAELAHSGAGATAARSAQRAAATTALGGFASALLAASSGCFATANREALQRGVAPEKLQCDEKQITMAPFAGETRIFTGCGREVWFTCASFPRGEQCFPMQDLRARASFEMDCADKAAIIFTPLDAAGHTVGASACGKRTVYQYVQTAAWKYDWVATSHASAESR